MHIAPRFFGLSVDHRQGQDASRQGPGGPVEQGSQDPGKEYDHDQHPHIGNRIHRSNRNDRSRFARRPAQAHANNGGAFVGGIVAGAIIGSALTRPVYAAPAYGVVYAPVQHCWFQKEFVGYNYKGQKMYQKVQVCD